MCKKWTIPLRFSISPLIKVFVVDNYFTGRKRNIEQWLGHENFEMLHQDIGENM